MGLIYVDAINSLKKKSIEVWQKFWDTSSESRGFYLHSVMPKIGCKSWFHDSRLYRRLIVLIIRSRMGHAATPRKLFQFNLRDTSFCDCDGIQMGDVNQIFLGCSKNTGAIDLFYIKSSQKIPFPTINAINSCLFQS